MVSGRVKGMNESIYYNVDAIQEAISKNVRSPSAIFDWGLRGEAALPEPRICGQPPTLCAKTTKTVIFWPIRSRHEGHFLPRLDRMSDISCSMSGGSPTRLTGPALQTLRVPAVPDVLQGAGVRADAL